jgi:hypothetical protein
MEFEVRHWLSNGEAGIAESDDGGRGRDSNAIGNVFYGSNGYLSIDGYTKYMSWLGEQKKPGPAENKGGNHFLNFIEAVRSRKRESLNADIETGAISSALINLANISYRVGRTLHFDEKTYSCVGDPEATALFTYEYRKPFVVPEKV